MQRLQVIYFKAKVKAKNHLISTRAHDCVGSFVVQWAYQIFEYLKYYSSDRRGYVNAIESIVVLKHIIFKGGAILHFSDVFILSIAKRNIVMP